MQLLNNLVHSLLHSPTVWVKQTADLFELLEGTNYTFNVGTLALFDGAFQDNSSSSQYAIDCGEEISSRNGRQITVYKTIMDKRALLPVALAVVGTSSVYSN